jgi:hypothetical protein
MANIFNATALANGTSNLNNRADALNPSTDLVQAGVVFNDAVRISTGLFSTPQNSGNSNPFLTSYTTDLHAVQNDIAAMLAAPGNVTLGGNAFTLNAADTAVLTNVQNQITTILAAAPQTTNAATLTAADQTIHTMQAQILQEINNDPHLANALGQVKFMATTGATDVAFQSTPVGSDNAATLAAATGGDFAAIGSVFNAAASQTLGGINQANLAQVNADFTAVQQGLTALLGNQAALAKIEAGETAVAAATTTLHLQTVLDQIGLQINKYDAATAMGTATGLRGTADNVLDIIDIVQNDANLNMAGGGNGAAGHVGGFAEMPGGLMGTVTKFQDNQVQTNFWGTFLSEANTMSAKLLAVANGTGTATQDLITQITNYQNFGVQFDMAQGAVFQGRFDNELVHGGLQSDSAAAIKALTGILNHDTGAALAADNAMLQASAAGFVGNAGDIAGNNIAVGGSAYVGSGTTIATTTVVNGIAMGTGTPVGATPNIANGTGGAPATSTTMAGGAAAGGAAAGGAAAGGAAAASGAGAAGAGTTAGNGTATAQHSGHHHHHDAAAAAAAAAAPAATAATHATAAAHSMPVIDHHAMAHMWG